MPYKDLEKQREKNCEYMQAWRTRNKEKLQSPEYREKAREANRRWADRNPNYHSEQGRRKLYGLEPEDVQEIKDSQNNQCAVCRIDLDSLPPRRACIDHCRESGKVRGMLCLSCNLRLGWLENNYDAIDMYLENYEITKTRS